jgi:hypothetical protein
VLLENIMRRKVHFTERIFLTLQTSRSTTNLLLKDSLMFEAVTGFFVIISFGIFAVHGLNAYRNGT